MAAIAVALAPTIIAARLTRRRPAGTLTSVSTRVAQKGQAPDRALM
jgi:hypothetical protein